jgi:hypothetical protein
MRQFQVLSAHQQHLHPLNKCEIAFLTTDMTAQKSTFPRAQVNSSLASHEFD